jgi:molybdopterin molybdotransferase
MAQLSSDQFAFGGQLLSVEDALARVGEGLRPVAETETVTLLEADGRVLAADLAAPVSLPPFFNSAVDGYAVRFADLTPGAETRLAVGGRVPAGAEAAAARAAGRRCASSPARPCPGLRHGLHAGGRAPRRRSVILPPGLSAGANCRPAGEDLPAGEPRSLGRPPDVARDHRPRSRPSA